MPHRGAPPCASSPPSRLGPAAWLVPGQSQALIDERASFLERGYAVRGLLLLSAQVIAEYERLATRHAQAPPQPMRLTG